MDIHLGEAEDMVLMYGLQKHLHIGPRGRQMGAGRWLWDTHAEDNPRCCTGVSMLESLTLSLPDGHEHVNAMEGPPTMAVFVSSARSA